MKEKNNSSADVLDFNYDYKERNERIKQFQRIASMKIPTYQEAEEILKHNFEKSFEKK